MVFVVAVFFCVYVCDEQHITHAVHMPINIFVFKIATLNNFISCAQAVVFVIKSKRSNLHTTRRASILHIQYFIRVRCRWCHALSIHSVYNTRHFIIVIFFDDPRH